MTHLTPLDDVQGMFSVDDYMYFYSDYLTAAHSDAETAAVVERLALDAPMRVLDLACGFGRIANRLALLGHRVTGVELLPGFVEIARHTAAQVGILDRPGMASVSYQQGDMRQIAYQGQFERVLMLFNSFGYFSDEENFDVLRRARRALVAGGLLGFDIGSRDGVLARFQGESTWEGADGSGVMINRFAFDPLTGRMTNHRVVFRDGKRSDKPFSIRLYTVQEISALLRAAGFQSHAFYGEWDGRDLTLDSTSMVVVARADG